MKTEEQVKKQYKLELEHKEAYESILSESKNPRFVHDRIELQESRIELLDWVLEQDDFQITLETRGNQE